MLVSLFKMTGFVLCVFWALCKQQLLPPVDGVDLVDLDLDVARNVQRAGSRQVTNTGEVEVVLVKVVHFDHIRPKEQIQHLSTCLSLPSHGASGPRTEECRLKV